MSRHFFSCPLRWGDLDAQGHVNNAAYVDYLQEARVDYLLAGPPAMSELLETGVLVVSHAVEYLRPLTFEPGWVEIELWVEAVGASRFVIGYEVRNNVVVARARTAAAPFDLATGSLRRLSGPERAALVAAQETSVPLRPLPAHRLGRHGHTYPLRVRWSDLDSYGHVNNVKYFDYVQEARIALMADAVGWNAGEIWSLVRQDLEYRRPLDFRVPPYAVRTSVVEIGTRSFTLAVQVEDPTTATVFATARSVVVGSRPVTERERRALATYREEAAQSG